MGLIVETGDLKANPFFEDAHGFAAGGIDLRFAPGSGFSETETVKDFDNEVDR